MDEWKPLREKKIEEKYKIDKTWASQARWRGDTRQLDYSVRFLTNPLDYQTIISMEGV